MCLISAVVSNPEKKLIIGILGGIGSGKSTAAAEFGKLGCSVIDADKIAHQTLDEAAVREKIVASFGESVLNSTGIIDHSKLADIVFADEKRLSTLNRLIHPLVLAQTQELIERYNRQDSVKAIVLDVPLLMEIGWAKRCDRLVFVDCKQELREKRAKKRGVFNKNQFKMREKLQISLDNKVGIADNTIDNNSGFLILARQVADIFSCVMANK